MCEYEGDDIRTARPNRHPPVKIDRKTVLKMEKEMDGNWRLGSSALEVTLEKYKIKAWPSTLNRVFKREGIRHYMAIQKKFLTIKHKKRRETFCKVKKFTKK